MLTTQKTSLRRDSDGFRSKAMNRSTCSTTKETSIISKESSLEPPMGMFKKKMKEKHEQFTGHLIFHSVLVKQMPVVIQIYCVADFLL